MPGEANLLKLLSTMQPELGAGTYVFVSIPASEADPRTLSPLMGFQEDEGLTLLLPAETAETASLVGSFPCRRITLKVFSALEAVGLLAVVTSRLAAAQIPVNVVSAFHHDHLFVPADRADEAIALLISVSDHQNGADSC
jgi:hypothetical protein